MLLNDWTFWSFNLEKSVKLSHIALKAILWKDPQDNFIEGQCVRVYHIFQLFSLILKSKQIFTGILCDILSPAHNKKNHKIFYLLFLFSYGYPFESPAGRHVGIKSNQPKAP
jgi:hypothetical protein